MNCNPKILVDHIDSRIDLVEQRIQQETKQLKAIVQFLQSLSKEVDKFAKGYSKVVQTLKASICLNNGWGTQLQGLLEEHTEIVKMLGEFETTINSTVAEPLDVFATKYQQRNTNVLAKALNFISIATSKRQYVDKAKKKFFKESKVAMGCSSEGAYKSKLKIAEEARDEYTQQIKIFNKTLDEVKEKYTQHLRSWLVNEECKLSYVKNMLSKFNGVTNGIGQVCAEAAKASEKLLNAVPTTLAIKDYIIMPNGKEKVFGNATFETPNTEDSEAELRRRRLTEICPVEATEEGVEFVKVTIQSLLDNDKISDLDRSKLMEIIKTERGAKAVSKSFSKVTQKIEINDYIVFNFLSEIAVELLDQMSQKKLDAKKILLILALGGFVTYYNESGPESNRIIYLRYSLTRHGIWNSKNAWRKMIKYKVKKSFENLQAFLMYSKTDTEEEKISLQGSINGNKQKLKEQETAGKKGIATTELSLFAIEMAFYSIDIEHSRKFIISIAKDYEIESDKLFNILFKYEIAQILPRDDEVQSKEILKLHLDKKKRKTDRYGSLEVLKHSLVYITDIKELRNILLLNKKVHELFRKPIYRHVLNTADNVTRLAVWKIILNDAAFVYTELEEEQILEFTSKNKAIENNISNDIEQTFSTLSKEEKDSTRTVLRYYVICNPNIGYYKGMHCIIVMLYLLYKNKQTVFIMFSKLMKNLGLVDMFKSNGLVFKNHLFVLNKLIAIYLPELHIHLFEEGIDVTSFSSSWLLTASTVVLQKIQVKEIPALLLAIYDDILTKGSKTLLKASLFILDYHKEQLLSYRDKKILRLFNELPAANFFNDSTILKAYKHSNYNITKELLKELNETYKDIQTRSNGYTTDIGTLRQEFKHLIYNKDENKYTQVYLPK